MPTIQAIIQGTTINAVTQGAPIRIVVTGAQGIPGPSGAAGPNTITSATTSDGTGNISLNTLEVLGTLTASHIHGNLAGSVYAHVRAGEALAKGDPVYVSGSHGSGSTLIPIVSKADAANSAKMPAVGVMDAAVANNANGHMVITGTITEFNTNAYSLNAELYVANGGGLTTTPPAASSQPVGRVERVNTNNGAFIVKVNGWASSGGNGVSDANKLVRFGTSGTIPISSVTGSRSGIDSRTSFPNDDVTAATSLAVNGTIVKRDGSGSIIITNLTVTGGTAYQSTASFVYLGSSAATHRTALGLGTAATANSSEFATSTHTHGNISNNGAIGTTSGLVVVTGTSGILTTQSRNGIDSRTSFPNDAVTAATASATPSTLVLRDATNATFFGTIDAENVIALDTEFTGSITFNNGAFAYGAGTAAAHRTALGLTSLATTTAGTGVTTALAINVGSSGAFVVNGGAAGTPSSITLTNGAGLPISTGVTGLGSGVATFLATPTSDNLAAALTDETGTSGGFVRAGEPTITSPSIAGSAQFTGTARPTSAATGSPAATDLITRADGDARYANFLYYKVSSALSANSTAKVFDTTTLTIPVGTYEVQVHGRAIYNGSNGGWSFGVERASGNTGTASALLFGHLGESGIFNNVTGAYRSPTFNLFAGNAILAASGSATSLHRTGQATSSGTLVVTSELVVVWYVAQVATDAANPTTLNENSFLLLKKIA